jgi:hypothetical protein
VSRSSFLLDHPVLTLLRILNNSRLALNRTTLIWRHRAGPVNRVLAKESKSFSQRPPDASRKTHRAHCEKSFLSAAGIAGPSIAYELSGSCAPGRALNDVGQNVGFEEICC